MQFVADVNVLQYKNDVVPAPPARHEPLLIIAGNVGPADDWRTQSYIHDCCTQFEHVIWVPGNIELWSRPMQQRTRKHYNEMLALLQDMDENLENLTVLHNARFDYKGWIFLGSTLWTHIPPNDFYDVHTHVDDYKYILNHFYEPIEALRTNMWHNNCMHFLNMSLNSIKKEDQKKVIVVTHYPPLSYGVNRVEIDESRIRAAYVNNLAWFIEKHADKIHTWVWGHTLKEYKNDLLFDGVSLLCASTSSAN